MTRPIDHLLAFITWRPLREFPGELEQIGASLFRIAENLYFKVVPYDRQLSREADGPFVTFLVWAESDGAALRAFNLMTEEDRAIMTANPQAQFLIAPSATTYGTILKAAQDAKWPSIIEHATYRIATDGKFVHRVIEAGGYHYFFRSRKHIDSEKPYCIALTEKVLEGTEP